VRALAESWRESTCSGYPGGAVLPLDYEIFFFPQSEVRAHPGPHERVPPAAEGYHSRPASLAWSWWTVPAPAPPTVTPLTMRDGFFRLPPWFHLLTAMCQTHLVGNDSVPECDHVGITKALHQGTIVWCAM